MEQKHFIYNLYGKKSEDKHLRTNWLYKNCFEFSEFELLRGITRTEFSVLNSSSKKNPYLQSEIFLRFINYLLEQYLDFHGHQIGS